MFTLATEARKLADMRDQIREIEQRLMGHRGLIQDLQARNLDIEREQELIDVVADTLELMREQYAQIEHFIALMERVMRPSPAG